MSTQIREVGSDGITRTVATPASQPGDTFPAGIVQMWTAAAPPSGWLICDGSAVSRATYPNLFSNIGVTWGSGDGSTTFNLPDFRDHMPIGAGLTYALAAAGGEATHTLTAAELPAHTHTTPAHTHSFTPSGTIGSAGPITTYPYATDSNTGTQHGSAIWGTASATVYFSQATNAHSHTFTGSAGTTGSGGSGSTGSVGSGSAHNNLPPYKGIHFIIRAY